MSNSLVEIPRPLWPQLRNMYICKNIYSSAYNLLQSFIDRIEQNPDSCIKIYSLNGDWEQDATFIASDQIKDHIEHIYFNTLSDHEPTRLHDAINCLDAKLPHLFSGFQIRFMPLIEQHFNEIGLTRNDLKPEGTVWFHCPRERVALYTIDAPAGIRLARLELQHAAGINNIWPHRSPGSLAFVENLILYNDSVGAFDEDGKLVAWCLKLVLGSLGLLQVLESHRRQGLGNLLVRYMAKLLAAKNLEVMAPVVFQNVASRAMFELLGFEIVDQVYWVKKPAVAAVI